MRFTTKAALLSVAVLASLSATGARAERGASTPPRCRYTATANMDGCAASRSGATTFHPDFFDSYAEQSGQPKYKVRPGWDVAGVDYPIGFYTPLDQLKDVRKFQAEGCNLKSLGGSQVLWCAGSGDLVISGYRFDEAGGTWLFLDSPNYTSVTVNDSYFVNGPAVDRPNGLLIAMARGDGTTECTKNVLKENYNTMLLTASALRSETGGGITTLMYLSGGNSKRSWKDITASHNGLVANRLQNGDASTSRMIEEGWRNVFGIMES